MNDTSNLPRAQTFTTSYLLALDPASVKLQKLALLKSIGFGVSEHAREVFNKPIVSFFGSERASAYGREVAYSMACDLSQAGYTVCSDMRLGIAGAALRGSLTSNAQPLAVLARSPQIAQPRSHRLLLEQISIAGFVIGSELEESAPTKECAAFQLNALIAISDAAVLVESNVDSTLLTSFSSLRDHQVPILAVPGPITHPLSAGPNGLIRDQLALTATDAKDVINAISEPS